MSYDSQGNLLSRSEIYKYVNVNKTIQRRFADIFTFRNDTLGAHRLSRRILLTKTAKHTISWPTISATSPCSSTPTAILRETYPIILTEKYIVSRQDSNSHSLAAKSVNPHILGGSL